MSFMLSGDAYPLQIVPVEEYRSRNGWNVEGQQNMIKMIVFIVLMQK